METRIVNFRHEKCDFKITRTRDNRVPNPPEEGWAGNPFPVGIYGREKCIEMYKEYFYKRINNDEVFREAILGLQGKKLGCFCSPLPCHGQIIKEYLDAQEQILGELDTFVSSSLKH